MTFLTKLIGQNRVVDLLSAAVAKNRIAPAYLFVGCPGVGRALTAKYFTTVLLDEELLEHEYSLILTKLVNHPDLLWVEPTYLHQGKMLTSSEAKATGLERKASPQIRIEQIRALSEFLSYPPNRSKRKVVVIEDARAMTESAANSLLKTLEEPGKATLILIASDTDTLLPTLVSRCQKIPFSCLSSEDLAKVLQENGWEKILQFPEIIALAQGSPGEAIACFERLEAMDRDLLEQLCRPPKNALIALNLAKTIEEKLDFATQLWLVDYLQYYYWQKWQKKSYLQQWEKARQYLLSYVQPRLVWECSLLALTI